MATKKQKRAAALAKHEKYMAELKRTGQEALRKERENREKKALEEWQEQHDKKHSWKKRIKECPHCTIELKASAQNAKILKSASA